VMANATFEKELENDEDLKVFCGKMFIIWMTTITSKHGNLLLTKVTSDPIWHYVVESIILEVKKNVVTMLVALFKFN
jgi:hypothetical protein